MEITYQLEPQLTVTEFVAVLEASGLAARRPVGDTARLEAMLRRADIVATARCAGELVGVARSLSDFAYCTYLSDLAVARSHQGRGIGRELVRFTRSVAGDTATLVLLAAPAAATYYPHLGMEAHPSCWVARPETVL